MNEEQIKLYNTISELISSKKEGEYWDFKQEWHSDKVELVKDIICFANTCFNGDCYLIFGISDKYEVIGINPEDKNKKKQADLEDMLSKLSWAGGHKPDIGLEEMTYKNKQLDILIIKNCTCTPIYLEEEYSPKGSNKKLLPCAIYARTDDRNTPINSSASMDMVEKLWKKRFHILEGVVDRIFNLLDDRPSDWKYSGTEEGTEYYYYKYDAAYNLKIEGVRNKDDGQIIIANPFTAFYGYTQFTPDVQCYKLNLYYSNQIPLVDGGYRIDVLDGERGIFPTPEIDSFNSHDPDFKKCLYAYYIIGSAKERLLRFLNRKRGQDQEFSYKKLERTVLFFESENQKKCFLEYYCVKHKEDIKNRFKRIKDSGSLVRTARSECNPELWNECSDNVCFSAALKEILEDFKNKLKKTN